MTGKKDTFGVSAILSKLSLEGEEDWMSHVAACNLFIAGTFLIFLLQLAAAGLHIYLVKQRDEYLVWPLVSFYLICTHWLLLPFSLGIPLSCFGSFKNHFFLMAAVWWPALSFSSEMFVWQASSTLFLSIFGVVLNYFGIFHVTGNSGNAFVFLGSAEPLVSCWTTWHTEKQDYWGDDTACTAKEI